MAARPALGGGRAHLDRPPRAGRRPVPGPPSARRRRGRHDGDRRLSLVRRLGSRHDDRSAGAHPRHRPRGDRPADSEDVRAVRGPGHASEPAPRWRPGPRLQRRGRGPLVRRGGTRLSRGHARRWAARGTVSAPRRDRPATRGGHALRDQGGFRRPAHRRRARRSAHLDGRKGGRLGRHAAGGQGGRDQRPLVQRATLDGRLRAAPRLPITPGRDSSGSGASVPATATT